MHVGAAIGERDKLCERVWPLRSFQESRISGLLVLVTVGLQLAELYPPRARSEGVRHDAWCVWRCESYALLLD